MDASRPGSAGSVGHTLAARVRLGFALFAAERGIEALGVGWLAGAIVAALALVTAPQAPGPQAWAAAGIAGSCAALSWWIEHGPSRRAYARKLDAASGSGGALTTVVDALERSETSELARALVRRVDRTIDNRLCLRAAWPTTPAILAAPLVGVAVLLIALDHAATSGVPIASIRAVQSSLESAARGVRAQARSVSASEASTITALAVRMERSAQDLSKPDQGGALVRGDLERLESLVRAEEGRLEPGSEVRGALARAAATLESARRALALDPDRPSSAEGAFGPGAPPHPGAGSEASGRASSLAAGEDPASSVPVRPVARTAPDGRMVPPQDAVPTSSLAPEPPLAPTPGSEAGVGTIRWWSQAYDGVVERWVEARRTSKQP